MRTTEEIIKEATTKFYEIAEIELYNSEYERVEKALEIIIKNVIEENKKILKRLTRKR